MKYRITYEGFTLESEDGRWWIISKHGEWLERDLFGSPEKIMDYVDRVYFHRYR